MGWSTSGAGSLCPSPQSPASQGLHGHAAMPGAIKDSPFAHTSHALLNIIHGCDLPLPQVLPQDHKIVQFL